MRPEPVGRTALGREFFDRDPAVVARDLLGKILVSRADGVEAGGRIVEAEAYLGQDDPGSHAATRGITSRNAVMYGAPATVYVYFTYGVHHMLNLVCGPEGVAGAVLIRAFEPTVGVETMLGRRAGRGGIDLSNGPGKVAQALGVDLRDNGTPLEAGRLTVYDAPGVEDARVGTSGRIGLSAGRDLPLRFFLLDSPSVSKARPDRAGPKRMDS